MRLKRLGRDLEAVINRPADAYKFIENQFGKVKNSVFTNRQKENGIETQGIAIKEKVTLGLPMYSLGLEIEEG